MFAWFDATDVVKAVTGNDWTDIAMKLGVPTLAFILTWRLLSKQDDRRQTREDKLQSHMMDMDSRRADQVDAFAGITKRQAESIATVSHALSKMEQLTRQIAGTGCGAPGLQGERGAAGERGPAGDRGDRGERGHDAGDVP